MATIDDIYSSKKPRRSARGKVKPNEENESFTHEPTEEFALGYLHLLPLELNFHILSYLPGWYKRTNDVKYSSKMCTLISCSQNICTQICCLQLRIWAFWLLLQKNFETVSSCSEPHRYHSDTLRQSTFIIRLPTVSKINKCFSINSRNLVIFVQSYILDILVYSSQ